MAKKTVEGKTIDINDPFLDALWSVIQSLAFLVKTQRIRLKKLWSMKWVQFITHPPIIPLIRLNYSKFKKDLNYRVTALHKVKNTIVSGANAIAIVMDMLFNKYFMLESIYNDYSADDLPNVYFLTGEKLVGALLQYIMLSPESVPLEILLVAKYFSLLTLRPLTLTEIQEDLLKNGIKITTEEIQGGLDRLIRLQYLINTSTSSQETPYLYRGKPFALSIEGEKRFQQELKPIIEWAIELYRSLYNIRSLHIPIGIDLPYHDELAGIVKYAALQGYTNTYYVFDRLALYYLHLAEEFQKKK